DPLSKSPPSNAIRVKAGINTPPAEEVSDVSSLSDDPGADSRRSGIGGRRGRRHRAEVTRRVHRERPGEAQTGRRPGRQGGLPMSARTIQKPAHPGASRKEGPAARLDLLDAGKE